MVSQMLSDIFLSSFLRVSYNGVIFDVESTGPYEVDILSISIAGMLNRVVWERRILSEIIIKIKDL